VSRERKNAVFRLPVHNFGMHNHLPCIACDRFQRTIRDADQLALIYGIPNPDSDTWMGLDDPFCSQGKGCLMGNKAQNLAGHRFIG
jgi:hypothetical protein